MKLNKASLFALFAVLELASDPERQLSTSDIADKYGISTHHLAKIMRNLVQEGMVRAMRGAGGGYRFAGNIVNGVPSADLPPILIALGASIRLVSTRGERSMALEDFFFGSAETVIAPGEILADITIPDQDATGSTYMKFGLRRSGALAVTGVAVSVTVAGDTLQEARIVLASAAPTVMRARAAEDFLRGKKISDELLAEAGELAAAASRPRDSIRGSAEYRRNLVGVLTKRALRKSIDEGHV